MENHKQRHEENNNGFGFSIMDKSDKSNTILSRYYKDGKEALICVAMRGRENGQELEPQTTGKTNALTSVQKDNLVMTKNYAQWGTNGFGQGCRAYYEDSKGSTLGIGHAMANPQILQNNSRIRRLTPTECARLQTIPEWYNWQGMSDTQRYRVLGNGWTVEVIKWILSFMNRTDVV
jgi:site-specific DNA-cytosine methylase